MPDWLIHALAILGALDLACLVMVCLVALTAPRRAGGFRA